jgi:hypothetical protein
MAGGAACGESAAKATAGIKYNATITFLPQEAAARRQNETPVSIYNLARWSGAITVHSLYRAPAPCKLRDAVVHGALF